MKKAILIMIVACLLVSSVNAFWECEPEIYNMPGTSEYDMGVLTEQTCYYFEVYPEYNCEPTTDPRYEICSDGFVRYPNGYEVVHVDRLIEMLDSLNDGQVEISNLMIEIINNR